ncbi:hypothetical protein [Spiroplasma endosymbiont of Clivina fossor]|uniref:hypothetical protein n=1 Tax=Spiroplasma endosymbiont of Clivina fossor TaxID=3066282 RepID=UPI00313E1256
MHIEIIYSKWLFFLFKKIPKKTKRDLNKIKYDLYDDENLEKCSKGSSFISKGAEYIPNFGKLISKAINSLGAICDLEK